MPTVSTQEIAATAARMVVEDGLEYGPAKQRALRLLGLPARSALPSNDEVEDAVREYITVFRADSQPGELRALRQLALRWMQRLEPFNPYLSGAVWHGTATRLSDIYLQLFCEDEKAAEIALIDQGVAYEPSTVIGLRQQPVSALSLHAPCRELGVTVGVHLLIHDLDDLRGALVRDTRKRVPRGDIKALERLLEAEDGC